MQFLRSIFPEEPDEDEVNRALFIVLLSVIMLAGSIWMLSPAQRLRAWWSKGSSEGRETGTGRGTGTGTNKEEWKEEEVIGEEDAPPDKSTGVPSTLASWPTVANNHHINRIVPGTFVDPDGSNQDSSLDDFNKPFSKYTEQDVANMKASWKKCLDGCLADAVARMEQISQMQAEARSESAATEAGRADAAEARAAAAQAQADTAERKLREYKSQIASSALFKSDPEDQRIIVQLLEERDSLQRQVDACKEAKRRSLLPRELEECQAELEQAKCEASSARKSLLAEQRLNRNVLLRQEKAEKIIREHDTSANTRRDLKQARATIAEQKSTIEQQRVNLLQHSKNNVELQSRVDHGVEVIKSYQKNYSEQKRITTRQMELVELWKGNAQKLETRENECIASKQQLQERYNDLHGQFQTKKTLLANSEKALQEARQMLSKSADLEGKPKPDIEALKSQAKTKDATIQELVVRVEKVQVAKCSMLHIPSGKAILRATTKSAQHEFADMLQQVEEKCSRAEAWQDEAVGLRKELNESDLDEYRQEIETLKEYLATSQAELMEARAPKGALKPDNKIKQMVALKQQVEDLKVQLKETQEVALNTENAQGGPHVELNAKITQLEAALFGQNDNVQKLQKASEDLAARNKDLNTKLAEASGVLDHLGPLATKAEAEVASLEKLLASERVQFQEATVANFTKENELKQLRARLENVESMKKAALDNLHGEGKAAIDNLQQQLNTAQQERAIAVTANNSLQIRLADAERERDAAVEAVLADNANSPSVVENKTLKQQLADLERHFRDTVNQGNSRMEDLTRSLNEKEQTIQGLNSKYAGWGARSANSSMIPQQKYDEINRENIRIRQENLRLDNWKLSMQGPNAPALMAQLKDEQIRRVRCEDRYNKLFPQIELLRKKLQACEDSKIDTQPTSTTAPANLSQVIQMNNALRGEITRNNERYTRQLVDLGRDRDGLLQRLSDYQRSGGDTELADCTQALRVATTKNVELQAWKNEHAFLVQQQDIMAEAERKIAAAQGDVEKAKRDAMEAGFTATRGVVRKKVDGEEEREGEDGEEDCSSPRKNSKTPRVEVEVDVVEDKNPVGDEDDEDSLFGSD